MLTASGEIYGWGLNEGGVLGLGLPEKSMVLTPVKINLGEPAAKLAAYPSLDFAAAIGESGTLYAWGMNLGLLPGTNDAVIPSPVSVDTPIKAEKLALSHYALTIADGEGNAYISVNSNRYTAMDITENKIPKAGTFTKVDTSAVGKIADIQNSGRCSAFLNENGEVFILGCISASGGFDSYDTPTKVAFPEKIIKLAAIDGGLVGLSGSGALYFVGEDRFGIEDARLDITDENYYDIEKNVYLEPVKVTKLGKEIKDFSCSQGSITVRTAEDEFYTWGYNTGRVDAESDDSTVFVPQKLNLPQNVRLFCMGNFSGAAITEDGAVYAWGSGYYGIYLSDTYRVSHEPVAIDF